MYKTIRLTVEVKSFIFYYVFFYFDNTNDVRLDGFFFRDISYNMLHGTEYIEINHKYPTFNFCLQKFRVLKGRVK